MSRHKRLVAFGVDMGKRHVRGVDTVCFRGQTLVVGKWNRLNRKGEETNAKKEKTLRV